MTDIKTRLIEAAECHVAFDGWSDVTFEAAVAETGIDATVARALFPRGAVDLAVASHRLGDAGMVAALQDADLSEMRFRDKVRYAVELRLAQCDDKEVVRRGTTLFALPQHAATGSGLIWGTADAIWRALGDTSEDINWYTKRATLSAVYGSTVLFWLGDTSDEHVDTKAFLERRIDNVMQFEKAKAAFKGSAFGKVLAGPLQALGRVQAPKPMQDFPGRWRS